MAEMLVGVNFKGVKDAQKRFNYELNRCRGKMETEACLHKFVNEIV